MTASPTWFLLHPDAARFAHDTYTTYPGPQKRGVWQHIHPQLVERWNYPGTRDACRMHLMGQWRNQPAAPLSQSGNISTQSGNVGLITDVLHIKKLHVHVPTAIDPAPNDGFVRAVLWGDTHYPFQDDAALALVAQVIRVVQPTVLVHMGDLLDCYHLSRFDKNPKRIHGLQAEIDMGRAHLAAMGLLAPTARKIFLEGNHCDRLRRTLWNMPPQAEALMALNAVTSNLTWPKLLGLDNIGWEFYAYGEQSKQMFLPKWLLKHGSVVRKLSAYTARAELDKYNVSGSSGHTHRLGMFFHRDHNGNHCWVETGCTCLLNPEYVTDPDWQSGCVVLTFEPTTGAFQAEPVYFHNKNALYRGHWYKAGEI